VAKSIWHFTIYSACQLRNYAIHGCLF
jgi:hypothetical protein